jgi:hypothetical protein
LSENIGGRREAPRGIGPDLRHPLRLSQRRSGHHAAAPGLARSGVDGGLAKRGHGLVDVRLRLKRRDHGSPIGHPIALDRLNQQAGFGSKGPVQRRFGDVYGARDPLHVHAFIPMLPKQLHGTVERLFRQKRLWPTRERASRVLATISVRNSLHPDLTIIVL